MLKSIPDALLILLFEKLPGLRLLNGYKTAIGRALEFVGGLTALLMFYYPQLPLLNEINGVVVLLIGIMVKNLGYTHAASKERRGL